MAKNWAIVVGVNAYKSIGDLKYANRDAEAMRDFFNEAQFDRVICFADELVDAMLPSFTELEDFLQDQFTADPLPLAPGDNCWFFFAGHGKRIDDCDYLLPIDYNPRMANPEKRAISVNFVREALLKSGADNVILLLDACRTEGDRSDGMGIGEAQPGAITIFSCQRHRKAYEIEALQQGAFTSALLEALRMPGERNCATVERLDLYLRDRVPQICRQHDKPDQVPMTLVEPRQKSYLILLPHFATDRDIAMLRSEAQEAELEEDFDLAEQLLIRVIAATGGRDLKSIQAYSRVQRKKEGRSNSDRRRQVMPSITAVEEDPSEVPENEPPPISPIGREDLVSNIIRICEDNYTNEPICLIEWHLGEENQINCLFRERRRGWYFNSSISQNKKGEWIIQRRLCPIFMPLLEPEEQLWHELTCSAFPQDWYALDEIIRLGLKFPGSQIRLAGKYSIGENVADEAMEQFGVYVPDDDLLPVFLFVNKQLGLLLVSYFKNPDGFAKENLLCDDNTNECSVIKSLLEAQQTLEEKLQLYAEQEIN